MSDALTADTPRPLTAWLAGGLLSAWAAHVVARGVTPIDTALPAIALIVAAVACVAKRGELLMAVPLLMAAEIAIDDERLRLVALGMIVALTLAAAVATRVADIAVLLGGVVLLRFLPLAEVEPMRELVVLLGVIALFFAFERRTPATLAATLLVALVTPTHPMRGASLPYLTAMLVVASRGSRPRALLFAGAALLLAYLSRPSLAELCIVAAAATLAVLPLIDFSVATAAFLAVTLFAWSGAVARGGIGVAHAPLASDDVATVGVALGASQSHELSLPDGTKQVTLTLTAANVSRMRRGTLLGRIDAGGAVREVRIGDVADFGFTRREHWFAARNPLPRRPTGEIRGYGATSWLYGASRVTLAVPRGARTLRVTGAASLPALARLQIETIEIETEHR